MNGSLSDRMYDVAHRGGGVPTMHQFDTWIRDAKKLENIVEAAREAEQLFHEHTFNWIENYQTPETVHLSYKQEFKKRFVEKLDALSEALEKQFEQIG